MRGAPRRCVTCGVLAPRSCPFRGWDHRRGPLVNAVDDFGVVDAAEVERGDRQVGVHELALDHEQRYALAGHLDRMRVAQLVRGKASPDTRSSCGIRR